MSRPDIDLELKTVASTSISCNHYKNNIGEIFQDSGESCLHCWQERTNL
jgi:hypothetical protein